MEGLSFRVKVQITCVAVGRVRVVSDLCVEGIAYKHSIYNIYVFHMEKSVILKGLAL